MVPRCAAGDTSTKYNGAAIVANATKKAITKRPPMNMGTLVASELIMVPTHTPTQPTNMCHLRPYQSASQTKRAPHIRPICVRQLCQPALVLGRDRGVAGIVPGRWKR